MFAPSFFYFYTWLYVSFVNNDLELVQPDQTKAPWFTFCLQEKKGQPPMDAAQRSEFENTKLNKILSMVREQPDAGK